MVFSCSLISVSNCLLLSYVLYSSTISAPGPGRIWKNQIQCNPKLNTVCCIYFFDDVDCVSVENVMAVSVTCWRIVCCRSWRRSLAPSCARNRLQLWCLTTSTTSYRHICNVRGTKWNSTSHNITTTTRSTALNQSNRPPTVMLLVFCSHSVLRCFVYSLVKWFQSAECR